MRSVHGWPGTKLTLEQIHEWPAELVESVEDFALFKLGQTNNPMSDDNRPSNNVFKLDEDGNPVKSLSHGSRKGRSGGKSSAAAQKRAKK